MVQQIGLLCLTLYMFSINQVYAETFDLGEIVVKENRQTITQVAAVDEISQDQLQQRGVRKLGEAISMLPGVYTNVGRRNELTFNLRGFEQRQVPVLLDGIALMVPYDGFIDSGSLPLDSLAKITVTRGNSSVLYGGVAMGGVVNMVSAKPERALEVSADGGIAERGTAWGHVRIASRQDRYYLSADYGYSDSDDFRLSDDYDKHENENGGVRQNSDRQRENIAIKVGLEPAQGHEYAIGIHHVDSEWGMPTIDEGWGRYWRFSTWKRTTGYLIGESRLGDFGTLHSRFFYDTFDNVLDSYDDVNFTNQTRKYAFHSTYDDYSYGGNLTFRPNLLPRHATAVAVHYRRDTHRSQSDRGEPWLKSRSEQCSYAIEDNFNLSNTLSMVIGLSYDQQRPLTESTDFDRQSEDAWNPLVGLNWQLGLTSRSWFSVAKKVRFPSLKELYSGLESSMTLSNEELKQERSLNYELGFEHFFRDDVIAQLSVFCAKINDLIESEPVGAGFDQLQNVGEARYAGAEVSLRYRSDGGHEFYSHYTFLDASNRSAQRSSDHLPYRSRHKFNLSATWKLPAAMNLVTQAQWNSRRYYQESTTFDWQTTDDYWLCHAQLNSAITASVQWNFGVRNLLDEEYQLEAGFPQAGRQIYTGLHVAF